MKTKKISEDLKYFLDNQNYTIVSTIDKSGSIHASCKGIVSIDDYGKIYLLDLFKGKTFKNLKKNNNISLTVVDEHKFKGYCIKGKAEIIDRNKIQQKLIRDWEKKITGRVSKRLIENIHGKKGHKNYPEFHLPAPEYLIVLKVKKIISLVPGYTDKK